MWLSATVQTAGYESRFVAGRAGGTGVTGKRQRYGGAKLGKHLAATAKDDIRNVILARALLATGKSKNQKVPG